MEKKRKNILRGLRKITHHFKNNPGHAPKLFLLLVFFALGIRLMWFISKYSVNLLVLDQWDYFEPLFSKENLGPIFLWQHGPHRQGLGFVVEALFVYVTRWDIRVASVLTGVYLLLGTVVALFLKDRIRRLEILDACIPLVILSVAQAQNLVIVPNPAHGAFTLMLLILYAASWTLSPRLKYPVLLALNFLLIHSGFGLLVGMVTPILLAWTIFHSKIRRRADAVALCVALASGIVFFRNYQFSPAVSCFQFPHPYPGQYLQYVGVLFGSYAGIKNISWSAQLVGVFMFLGLGGIGISSLLQSRGSSSRRAHAMSIASLALYTLFFAVTVSVGRVCLGISQAQSSRYITHLIPGALGLYVSLAFLQNRVMRRVTMAVFFILIFIVESGAVKKILPETGYHFNGKRAWVACYIEHESVAACNAKTGYSVYPWPDKFSDIEKQLQRLKKEELHFFSR